MVLPLLALLLPGVALGAVYTVTLSNTTASSVVCRTYYKSTSTSAIPTHRSKKQLPPDYFIFSTTTTPYKTITPKASTTTSTVVTDSTTTTTLSTVTGTVTVTSTETDTTTSISTVATDTTTTGSATATTTSTVVIPAPSGFITVDESSGDTNYTKRSVEEQVERSPPQALGLSFKDVFGPSGYPAKVSCITSYQPTYTIEVIKIHSTVRTTAAPATSTALITSTSIITATDAPSATSTATVTDTTMSTVVSTITTTTNTVTTTITTTGTAMATIYAQCAPNNLLGSHISDGRYIGNIYSPEVNYAYSEASDAYDCCMQCVNLGDQCFSGGFDLLSDFSPDINCVLATDKSMCSVQQSDGTFYDYSDSGANGHPLIVFNGACGYLTEHFVG